MANPTANGPSETMAPLAQWYAKRIAADLLRFRELKRRWDAETGHLSSLPSAFEHPAFREIVEMGWPAVPFILDEMRRQPDWCFQALAEITGERPTKPEHAGKLRELVADWLRWGEENGYA